MDLQNQKHKTICTHFEKVQNRSFLTPRMVKNLQNDPLKCPKWVKCWPKISIFVVIYQLLELKIHPNVGLIKAQTMPKHFPNKSKKLRKSPENDFLDPQNGQITGVKLAKSVDFWVHFRCTSSIFGSLALKKILKSFPLIVKHIWKKKEKNTRSFSKKKKKTICTPVRRPPPITTQF